MMFTSLFFLLGLAAAGRASTVAQEHQLFVDLMKHYDPYVHPHEENDAVDVHFDFEVTRVVDFDTEHQVLTLDAFVVQEWHDSSLEWNTAKYGGVSFVNLPLAKIWHPDVVAIDSAGEFTDLFDSHVKAHVDHYGNVTYVSPVEYHFYCHTEWHVQPNHDVYCPLEFTSWNNPKEAMDLHFLEKSHKKLHQLDGDFFHADFNNEWTISHVDEARLEHEYACCPGEHYPILLYNLTLHHLDHCHE